jgi:hypothetical protein
MKRASSFEVDDWASVGRGAYKKYKKKTESGGEARLYFSKTHVVIELPNGITMRKSIHKVRYTEAPVSDP